MAASYLTRLLQTLGKRAASCVLAALTLTPEARAKTEFTREDLDFFEKEIRPVLTERCLECHSATAKKLKGGLNLETRDALLKGGESGAVAIPGDPEASRMIAAVRRHDAELQMPPKNPLSGAEVAVLVEWVRRGLPDPRTGTSVSANAAEGTQGMTLEEGRAFWSFKPLAPPQPPSVRNTAQVQSPVDAFILERLEREGIPFAPPADKRTLLRRASFDLTGLPPTPEQLRAFEADAAPGAFARVVDSLLESPAYGERWGRHWLDVVRYADTCGNASDYPVPQAHLYRDWVIEAVGADMPYDRFLRAQIAGDLLPADDEQAHYQGIIATGYLAMAKRFAGKAGAKHLTIEDTIDNLSRTVLGVSLSCARCHNHKFDPFTVEDYYGLYGFFQSTRYPYPGAEGDSRQDLFIPLMPQAEIDAKLAPHKAELAHADTELKSLEARQAELKKLPESDPSRAAALGEITPKVAAAKKKAADLAARPPLLRTAYAVTDEESPCNAKIQIRGEPKNPGAEVPRKFPEVLGGMTLPAQAKGSGRLELAGWLSSHSNPLTARVMVNRIWLHHFGRGLVETPNDFGKRGRPPTHPELLDYLASEFVRSGWSIKAMHRLILLSRTWQLASQPTPESTLKDAANTLLSHATRRRLDAESIRDALLFVSGELSARPAGEHPFPPRHTWSWTQHRPFAETYPMQSRSVYLMQSRLKKNAYLALFDGADPSASTGMRSSTITPLQALFSMNDPLLHKCAESFAKRLSENPLEDAERVHSLYMRAFCRAPSPGEKQRSLTFLSQYREALAAHPLPASEKTTPEAQVWSAFARSLLTTNEFVYLD